MLFIFQFTVSSGRVAKKASRRAKAILKLIKKSRKQPKKEKKNLIPNLDFESVKIEKRDDCIFYMGPVTEDLTMIGFMGFEGHGQEVLIQRLKEKPISAKGHKIIMFKTKIDYGSHRNEYFTKSILKVLIRDRIS